MIGVGPAPVVLTKVTGRFGNTGATAPTWTVDGRQVLAGRAHRTRSLSALVGP